ncbi:hypothetical protein HD806DRAFT_543618 [Xylariaceae sp. AK1471]|nr:hypothetical protein HD806DRAFT_543618 [Xylariaceae sp. AK1471]
MVIDASGYRESVQNIKRRASETENTSLRYVIPNRRKEGSDGRTILVGNLLEYRPPDPLETDKFKEWNMGDELPKGGPLPIDKVTNNTITAIRAYGVGTRADPMVLFSNKEILKTESQSKKTLEAYIVFTQQLAKQLHFTHIWIRKQAHSVETKRNATTGKFTGETKKSQSHITVLLGNADEWVNVGGHIFIFITGNGEKLELMSREQMWLLPSGERRRVVELWKWDEGDTFKQEHAMREIRAKKTWNRGSKLGRQLS